MTKALLTITIGDLFKRACEITHPTLKDYAKKIGADFINITEQKYPSPYYVKFMIADILEKYDRVLYLDSDILINPNAPDIFEIVPEDKIGMADDSILGYHNQFGPFLHTFGQSYFDDWIKHKKCYNAGVIVASKKHQSVFKLPSIVPNHHFDQEYINLKILEEGAEVFDLPIQYNRRIYLDAFIPEHRLKSHIIHYAGIAQSKTLDEYIKFLQKEYRMLISQDFSEDNAKIVMVKM